MIKEAAAACNLCDGCEDRLRDGEILKSMTKCLLGG